MQIISPGCHLHFWVTGYKSEVPMMPSSWDLINILDHWCTVKEHNSGTARLKSKAWRKVWTSMPCPGMPLSCTFTCSLVQKLSKKRKTNKLFSRAFMKASLQNHDWLSYWILAMIKPSAPLPSLEQGWGWRWGETESSKPPVRWLGLLAISPYSWVESKSHLH